MIRSPANRIHLASASIKFLAELSHIWHFWRISNSIKVFYLRTPYPPSPIMPLWWVGIRWLIQFSNYSNDLVEENQSFSQSFVLACNQPFEQIKNIQIFFIKLKFSHFAGCLFSQSTFSLCEFNFIVLWKSKGCNKYFWRSEVCSMFQIGLFGFLLYLLFVRLLLFIISLFWKLHFPVIVVVVFIVLLQLQKLLCEKG